MIAEPLAFIGASDLAGLLRSQERHDWALAE